LGTIEKIDDSGNLQLRLDSGRTVAFNIKENPHLDYGYAVTSHSSQGQTADRVLVHVDTEQAGEKLVDRRLAYVAVSRGATSADRPGFPPLPLRDFSSATRGVGLSGLN